MVGGRTKVMHVCGINSKHVAVIYEPPPSNHSSHSAIWELRDLGQNVGQKLCARYFCVTRCRSHRNEVCNCTLSMSWLDSPGCSDDVLPPAMDLYLPLSLAFVGFNFALLTNITYTQRKQFGKSKVGLHPYNVTQCVCCVWEGGVCMFELMKLEYVQNEN